MIEASERERDHYHCPVDCEHPQPFAAGEMLLCGRCWFVLGEVTVMVECAPEVCPQ